jgi:hypothetical protein
MPNPWAERHADLPADAVNVLTAVTVLGLPAIAIPDLAVAVGTEESAVTATIAVLRHAQWIETLPDSRRERLVEAARIWLVYDAPNRPSAAQTAPIAERYLAYHRGRLDQAHAVEWARAHRDAIIRAIQAGIQTGQYAAAAELARATWAVADQIPDRVWWRELAHHGEDAAIQGRDPQTLIALLNLSAAAYLAATDFPAAQVQLVRVAQLAFEMTDHDGIIASLTALLDLYRRWHHDGEALDVLLELADEHHRVGDIRGRAEALAQLGYIMLANRRPSRAEVYLETANQLLTTMPAGSVQPTMHARVLEQWGRAQWRLGHPIRARRRFSQALALLGDHDPAGTARLRRLLDTHIDAADLPPDDQPDRHPHTPATQPVGELLHEWST